MYRMRGNADSASLFLDSVSRWCSLLARKQWVMLKPMEVNCQATGAWQYILFGSIKTALFPTRYNMSFWSVNIQLADPLPVFCRGVTLVGFVWLSASQISWSRMFAKHFIHPLSHQSSTFLFLTVKHIFCLPTKSLETCMYCWCIWTPKMQNLVNLCFELLLSSDFIGSFFGFFSLPVLGGSMCLLRAAGVMKNNDVLYTESADWSIPCAVCCIFSLTYELRICLVLCWVLLIWSNYLTVYFFLFSTWSDQPVFKVTFVSCVLDQFYVVQQLGVLLSCYLASDQSRVLFIFFCIFLHLWVNKTHFSQNPHHVLMSYQSLTYLLVLIIVTQANFVPSLWAKFAQTCVSR